MAPRIPTDREILREIYDRYYAFFVAYSSEKPNRKTKNYVPIDLNEVGAAFGIDGDIIFSRLHNVLDKRYRYKNEDGSIVPLFYMEIGGDRHCVQFPLLASVLADMEEQRMRQFVVPTTIAVISLLVSVVALVVSVMRG